MPREYDILERKSTPFNFCGLPRLTGFVTQIGLRLDFPLPQTELAYGHGARYVESCEAV